MNVTSNIEKGYKKIILVATEPVLITSTTPAYVYKKEPLYFVKI